MWTAFSRTLGKIVAYVIGEGRDCAFQLYSKAKQAVGNIEMIYTDPNSCYAESFKANGVITPHVIAEFKEQTHRIEATNSSLRDNLARFNRMTKRYSKAIDMLDCTVKLFCNSKQFSTN